MKCNVFKINGNLDTYIHPAQFCITVLAEDIPYHMPPSQLQNRVIVKSPISRCKKNNCSLRRGVHLWQAKLDYFQCLISIIFKKINTVYFFSSFSSGLDFPIRTLSIDRSKICNFGS